MVSWTFIYYWNNVLKYHGLVTIYNHTRKKYYSLHSFLTCPFADNDNFGINEETGKRTHLLKKIFIRIKQNLQYKWESVS